jgi:hypothetical protein
LAFEELSLEEAHNDYGLGTSSSSYKAIIFDLGGVIVSPDYPRAASRFRQYSSLSKEEVLAATQISQAKRLSRLGRIEVAEFIEMMREELYLSGIDDATLLNL